ncbi:protein NRT1/ PTR FAMILY 5.14-like [Rutidosis leptorrhynchoides]|uniref:protein NRT1/ PTR FAMILY 5.14-like n=1 Tax=Rutidosis leptorrhynchoides TaxID=125765 RepID=UPI003A9916BE
MDLVIISYSLLAFTVVSSSVLLYLCRKYYFFFHKNILYVLGLVFSRSLTNNAVVDVLMWYLSYYDGDDLVMSAVLSNVQDSLSSLLVIVMAHSADSWFGRFRTLLFSNTAYIGGLLLLWMFNPYDMKWLVIIAIILLSIGKSGDDLSEDVLIDLVKDIDLMKNNELENDINYSYIMKRSEARAVVWCRIAYVFGAISATLWVTVSPTGGSPELSWRTTFLICIIAMFTTSIPFVAGYNLYYQKKLIQRPIDSFFRVCRYSMRDLRKFISRSLAIISRHDTSAPSSETRTKEHEGTTQDREEHENRESNNLKKDMAKVKSLIRLFPVWGSYFVVALVSATGNTFFLEQFSNLHASQKLPIQIYTLIQQVSSFSIPFLYRWATCSRKNEKVKIGLGMLFSNICCIFAWQLEVHRLKGVKRLADDQDENTSISFLWLFPQFVMLGCMEGLTNDGLLKFFKSQVNDKGLESYGEEYNEVVLGVGKLFTIASILIFKSRFGWFTYTINKSQLDKNYIVLIYICSVNFVYYCFIATCFFKDDKNREEDSASDVSESLEHSQRCRPGARPDRRPPRRRWQRLAHGAAQAIVHLIVPGFVLFGQIGGRVN